MKLQKVNFWKSFSLASILFVPVLFGYYSVTLGQDINWDLLNYHLYNPYSYIQDRITFDLAPAGQQTYFNPLLDVVYLHAVNNLNPKAVGFSIGLLQGLSYIFIRGIVLQVLGKERYGYAFFLGLLGVLSVGFLSQVGTSLHDSLVGVLSLASLWLAILAIGHEDTNFQRNALTFIGLAAAIAGFAAGLKLTFAIYALSLLIGLLFVPIHWNVKFKLFIVFGICAFAAFLLTGGYWFYKMWILFGNPIFPQFNHLFQGELAAFEAIRDIRFLPRNIYEKIFYPAIFTNDPHRVAELQYKQVSWIFGYVALVALGCAALLRAIKTDSGFNLSPQMLLLVSYFSVAYVLWLNMFGIYRYLIPLEVLIPLLIYVAFDIFFKTSVPRFGAIIFLSLLTFANLKGVPDWGRSNWATTSFRVEASLLDASPEPAVIYLVGQPLAWIIPALDINVPFIQLNPNMPVNSAYWSRAKDIAQSRVGRQFAIFEAPSAELVSLASVNLARLGYSLNEGLCHQLVGYLGTKRYEYRFCEVGYLGE